MIATTSGTAVAATMINGKNIKAGTVTSKQLKDRGVLRRDLGWSAVASGQVANGSLAEADLNTNLRRKVNTAPWRKIPSGVTVTGQEYFQTPATSSVWNVKMPAKAPVALSDAKIAWGPDGSGSTTDHDPACTGSYGIPTAPAGMLCLYLGSPGSTSYLIPATWSDSNLRTQAFYVSVGSSSSSQVWFTWAYTAP